MDLLLGNGEGLRGDVSDDSGLLAVRSVGEHRESVCACNTSLFHNCHVGDLQHPAVAISFVEVSDGRRISQYISKVEGTNAEFGRGAATGTRGIESVPEGNHRGDRKIRRCMRSVSVRDDEGQSDALPSSLSRGLFATMPQDERQMSHVQARAQVRLNDEMEYSFDCLQRFIRLSKHIEDDEERTSRTFRMTLLCLKDLETPFICLDIKDLRRRWCPKDLRHSLLYGI